MEYLLPLPNAAVANGAERGIITGAQAVHWPCLGALVLGAHANHVGLAVADHGLATWQRSELERVGVDWIEHDRFDFNLLATIRAPRRISARPQAWWKPLVCLASPFHRSAWIDSDAIVIGDISPLFNLPKLGAARKEKKGAVRRATKRLLVAMYGSQHFRRHRRTFWSTQVNSGVVAFTQSDRPVLAEWADNCRRILSDARLLAHCPLRDEAALQITLAHCRITSLDRFCFLDPSFNTFVEPHCTILNPADLYYDSVHRYAPAARIVHWAGRNRKPWGVSHAKALAAK